MRCIVCVDGASRPRRAAVIFWGACLATAVSRARALLFFGARARSDRGVAAWRALSRTLAVATRSDRDCVLLVLTTCRQHCGESTLMARTFVKTTQEQKDKHARRTARLAREIVKAHREANKAEKAHSESRKAAKTLERAARAGGSGA